MLKNYLKIALRNLRKNRGASAVNIIGLAIGLASCTLILLFIQDELSYDRYHSRADQIVRVVKDFVNEDGSRLPDATTPPALAPAMVQELPEVEKTLRLFTSWGGRMVIEKGEEQFQSVLFAFSLLAIFVACLGLLALVAYTIEQRIKEIGIRKVLGVSIRSIVLLLSGEFLWLVTTGLLIAIPVAWYAMNQWLNNFAFRIDIDWWVFGLTALLAIIIAFATLSVHAFRAAKRNPVESLRYE